ncbi:MAG: RHS repeat-associated core domain-containing protein, partial [Methanosarcinaceae archaeon]
RQLADTAGAVTLTQGYAPYGEVMQSVGTSQTSYAFTGENRDANGLTYLRARYLDSSVGRFITRDVWPGNLERSLSLNKWIYAEGNPIRYTDPSGYVIRGDERGEIGDIRTNPSTHYQYSCNCGWIDWAHATAEMANYKSTAHDVYNGLTAPIDWSAYSYWSGSWNGSRGVQLVTVMNIKENYVPIVRATAVIQEKTLQNKQLLTPIATGIFMEYSLKVEDFHALSLLNGRNSWYAEEDLPSNMIGFYIATRMRRDNISYEVALQEVQKLCGIMDKKDSLKVFDYDYGGGISFLQGWKRWDARLMPLNCSGADCIEGTRQWPSQFSTLATSASHSGSNGSWHFLSSNSHEMLFPTDTEGVYGVMYVLYGHP